MPTFLYKAKTRKGDMVTDVLEAENERMAIAKLQEAEYFLVSLTEEKIAGGLGKEISRRMFQRIRSGEIAAFTRQMADLIDSGLPLVRALTVLSKQGQNEGLRAVISSLRDDVQGGSSLAEALGKHPKLFSRLFINMVRAGEASGALEEVLGRLASFAEKDEELRGKVRTALAYPSLMALVGLGTVFFLLTVVIPKFVILFEDMEKTLPLLTQLLLNLSHFLGRLWWLILALIIFAVVIFRRLLTSEGGKLALDRLKLRLPLLGRVTSQVILSRFSRTLGTLLSNGVPILDSLSIVKEIVGNKVVEKEIEDIERRVGEGEGLAQPMSVKPFFPPSLVDTIRVGEEGGFLEKSLLKVANSYDREVENSVRVFTSLLEPAMIIIMAIAVGFLVLAMILPILTIEFSTY